MKTCQKCNQRVQQKGHRFCGRHAREELLKLEAEGYFDPLQYQTQDGKVVLSRQRFLTISE